MCTRIKLISTNPNKNDTLHIRMSIKSQCNWEYIINGNDAYATICRNFMSKSTSDQLCDYFRRIIPFEQFTIKSFGRNIEQPRRQYSYGDPDVKAHVYSGLSVSTHTWIPEIKEIRDIISHQTGIKLNSCLVNEYATGSNYVSYHSDKEKRGFNNIVFILSLGGSRDFYFKRKVDGLLVKLVVNSGDALIMYGQCQELWQHSIPKRSHANYRISLSFRDLQS